MTSWRLIPYLEAAGTVQMQIDYYLLQGHRYYQQPSCLRFYTWSPPAISLGYHQRRYPEAWQQLAWQGQSLALVRRPTGGRAVLHQGDLTYMVVTSGLKGKVVDIYRQLCQFLIVGWRSLGVDLSFGSSPAADGSPNCFNTATGADLITPEGYKFIGSALLKQGDYILQHGSMRLNPAPELYQQVFTTSSPAPLFPQLTPAWLTLVIDTLTEAAQSCFGTSLVTQPLSQLEWQQITSDEQCF